MTVGQSGSPSKSTNARLAAAVGLLALGAGALYWGYAGFRPTGTTIVKPGRQAWCFDVANKRLYAAAYTGQEVRARVFSTGSCAKEQERFIGYLERQSPEAASLREAIRKTPGRPPDSRDAQVLAQGTQFGRPEAPDQWFAEASEEGQAIRSGARADRDGKPVVECSPDSP